MVRDYLDKWIVNANEIFSQRPKIYMLFIYYEILIIRQKKESANSHSPFCSTIEILS
jgi:hypothetical protein